MNLIHQAQVYFKKQGINQWQNGYPNEENILNDIKSNHSYVLEENVVLGTMYFSFEEDPNYKMIEGNWINDEKYGVIHRIVVDENSKGKGLAYKLLEYGIQECKSYHIKSLRIDTHEDNLSMRKFLTKNGFVECGVIYIDGVSPRIAYEKMV